MQAGDILTAARQGLSDTGKKRWSDARLLTLLNDGLNILTVDTILFIEKQYVELFQDLEEYDISNEALKILRIEYKGVPLKLVSHEYLDKISQNWKQHTGSVFTCAMTDKHRPGRFRLYPKVAKLDNTLVEQTGTYGIITDITYTDYQLEMTGDEGEIGTPDSAGWVYVHYLKRFNKLTALTDEIDLDDFILTALEHYVIARALRDNMDTQNRALANEEMSMFEAVTSKYSIAKSKLYSDGSLEASYRGGIV